MYNNDLTAKVTKFSGIDSGNTYVTVDQLAYDATNKKLGLKVNGADTVIPFSSGSETRYMAFLRSVAYASTSTTAYFDWIVASKTSPSVVSYSGTSSYPATAVVTILNNDYCKITITGYHAISIYFKVAGKAYNKGTITTKVAGSTFNVNVQDGGYDGKVFAIF